MKTKFILIIKTILFWYTIILLTLSIANINNIVEQGFYHLVAMFIINIGLIILCKLNITADELYVISGIKWLLNKLK